MPDPRPQDQDRTSADRQWDEREHRRLPAWEDETRGGSWDGWGPAAREEWHLSDWPGQRQQHSAGKGERGERETAEYRDQRPSGGSGKAGRGKGRRPPSGRSRGSGGSGPPDAVRGAEDGGRSSRRAPPRWSQKAAPDAAVGKETAS